MVAVYEAVVGSVGAVSSANEGNGSGDVVSSPALLPNPSPALHPPPAKAASGGAPSQQHAAAPASASASAGTLPPPVTVINMLNRRTLNITLLPLSDPLIFDSLALQLVAPARHHLLLCGLPQPLLYAAAVQLFGAGFDASRPNATQLADAGAQLAQALRGNPDAASLLEHGDPVRAAAAAAAATAAAEKASRGLRGNRLASGRKLLAGLRGLLSSAAAAAHGGWRRQLLAGEDVPEPAPAPKAAAPAPSAAASGAPPVGSSSPPQRPAAPLTFRLPLPAASAGSGPAYYTLYVNLQYVEWCSGGREPQPLDLALVDRDMQLLASSGQQALLVAAEPALQVGPLLRKALLAAAAVAAAAQQPAGAGAGASGEGAPPSLAPTRAGGPLAGGRSAACSVAAPDSSSNVSVIAPDNLTLLPVRLELYVDYQEAVGKGLGSGACRQSASNLAGNATLTPSSNASSSGSSNGTLPVADSAAPAGNATGVLGGDNATMAAPPSNSTRTAPGGISPAEGEAAARLPADGKPASPPATGALRPGGGGGAGSNTSAGAVALAVLPITGALPQQQLAARYQQPGLIQLQAGNALALAAAAGSRLRTAASGLPRSPFDDCLACDPGTYSDALSASECLLCAPGSSASLPASSSCDVCPPGSATFAWGSATCRPCLQGTYTARNGSTACEVCPPGMTTAAPGGRTCAAAPPPPSSGPSGPLQYALRVNFQLVINVSQGGLDNLGALTTGINATGDAIFKLLIAADTADALRIAPAQVRVSNLHQMNPSAFLVNVSATVPLAGANNNNNGRGGADPPKEVDADQLVQQLVGNPGNSFQRTSETTGAQVQVTYVDRQVVSLPGHARDLNVHAIVWPTIAGTMLLAVAVAFSCGRYCKRRRRQAAMAMALPPIMDFPSLGLSYFKAASGNSHTSGSGYAAMDFASGPEVELQDAAGGSALAAARFRMRGGGGSVSTNVGRSSMHLSQEAAALQDVQMFNLYYNASLQGPKI